MRNAAQRKYVLNRSYTVESKGCAFDFTPSRQLNLLGMYSA